MQAILIKYIGPTDTKGSRIKATCARGSITIGYPHHASDKDKPLEAVKALCAKFAEEDKKEYGTNSKSFWKTTSWAIGELPNGDHCAVSI